MYRHNNKYTSENPRNNNRNMDAASNTERSGRNTRIIQDQEREKIRYTQKNIFRLNDLYERGSI